MESENSQSDANIAIRLINSSSHLRPESDFLSNTQKEGSFMPKRMLFFCVFFLFAIETSLYARCTMYKSCHVNSPSNPYQVGFFSKNQIQKLKKSSILLSYQKNDGSWEGFCSGVLIHQFAILTAAHCINNAKEMGITADKVSWTLNREYTGSSVDTNNKKLEVNRPWGYLTKILESSSAHQYDYALVKISWVSPIPVNAPIMNQFSNNVPVKDQQVILISHPKGEPTQFSVAKVSQSQTNPPIYLGGPLVFSKSYFSAQTGSSGGGVFDRTGKLIGIMSGVNLNEKYWIQMDELIDISSRLEKYFLELSSGFYWAAPFYALE
ncbi:MAG: serine protease [Candidatus Electrothrix sp. EH2]|nr:serine protease [Candidatus Electrothrix sp. EH2]